MKKTVLCIFLCLLLIFCLTACNFDNRPAYDGTIEGIAVESDADFYKLFNDGMTSAYADVYAAYNGGKFPPSSIDDTETVAIRLGDIKRYLDNGTLVEGMSVPSEHRYLFSGEDNYSVEVLCDKATKSAKFSINNPAAYETRTICVAEISGKYLVQKYRIDSGGKEYEEMLFDKATLNYDYFVPSKEPTYIYKATAIPKGFAGTSGSQTNPPAPETYTTVFDSKGGSAVADSTAGTIATEPVPKKDNNTFGGWFDNVDCRGERIIFPYTPTASGTLYAKWTENAPQGNDFALNLPQKVQINYDFDSFGETKQGLFTRDGDNYYTATVGTSENLFIKDGDVWKWYEKWQGESGWTDRQITYNYTQLLTSFGGNIGMYAYQAEASGHYMVETDEYETLAGISCRKYKSSNASDDWIIWRHEDTNICFKYYIVSSGNAQNVTKIEITAYTTTGVDLSAKLSELG